MEKINELTQLEELEKKYTQVNEGPNKFRVESEVEPLYGDELDEYMALTEEEKQSKYPEPQRAATEKLLEIQDKVDAELLELDKQINNKAVQAYKVVTEKIEEKEKQIQENDIEIENLDNQIKELNEKIALKEQELQQLEVSENFDQDKYEQLNNELEQLKSELATKVDLKKEKTDANEKLKSELEELQAKKVQLSEDYVVIQNEMKIADLTKQYNEIKLREDEKYEEYMALKQTDGYKNKEQSALDKAEQLAKEVMTARLAKEAIAKEQNELRKAINEMTGREAPQISKTEKQPIDDVTQATDGIEQGQDDSSEQGEQQDNPEKKKTNKVKSGRIAASGVVTAPISEEKTNEEKSEEKEQRKEPKDEFKELYAKAKKENLDDKDFDRLVVIMSDTENYDKYGITTGIVFNNGRKIFEALNAKLPKPKSFLKEIKSTFGEQLAGVDEKEIVAKVAAMDQEKLTDEQKLLHSKAKKQLDVNEAYGKYLGLFFERNEKKIPLMKLLSKPFIIPEYENRKLVKALDTASNDTKNPSPKTTSDSFEDMRNKVVPPEEEQPVKTSLNRESEGRENR